MIHTVKGFSVLSEAEVDVFLEFSCIFLWSNRCWQFVPLPFLNQVFTSGSSWFTYCWSLAWRVLSITLLVCEMSALVRQFEHSLALPFFGIGMKTDLFLASPRNSQETSPVPQFESTSSSVLSFFYVPSLTLVHDCWKNHSLTMHMYTHTHTHTYIFGLWLNSWHRAPKILRASSVRRENQSIKPVNPRGNQPWIFIGRTKGRKRKGQ